MSTALALATVSAILSELLQERMNQLSQVGDLGTVKVRVFNSELNPSSADGSNHLDLFFYRVAPNVGWRNVGLPSLNSSGQPVSNPPLALNLHYLLIAYSTKELHAEVMLGFALQTLHQMPVLTRKLIQQKQKGWAAGQAPLLKSLAADTLADQVELVKLSPETLSTEELSRLWAAFQFKYRPSAAYQASVVLIESDARFEPAPPVREARVHAIPFARPVIQSVSPQIAAPGDTLTVEGQGLASSRVQVRFGAAGPVAPKAVSEWEIKVELPRTLRAGINTVQVVHSFDLSAGLRPVDPPVEFESNIAAFILRPSVQFPLVDASHLRVEFDPKVGRTQNVQLLLDQVEPPQGASALAARIPAPTDNGIPDPNQSETTSIDFVLSALPSGDYFVRVRVDAAYTALDLDPNSPDYGPTIKVP
jgi:hypothetical protein